MHDGLFFRILRRVNLVMFTLLWIALLAAGGLVVWKEGLPKHLFTKDAELDYTGPQVNPTPTYSLVPEAFEPPGYQQPTLPSIYVYTRSFISADLPPISLGNPAAGEAVNLLVIDDKGEGHWLFKDNKRVIIRRDAVRKGPAVPVANGAADQRPILGLVIETAERDANNDGILNEYDPAVIYAWKQGATALVKLLDAHVVVNSEQVSETRWNIVYSEGKETRVAVFSLPDFEKLSDKPLPKAP